MKKKAATILLLSAALVTTTIGCSKNSSELPTTGISITKDPVTIKVYNWDMLADNVFQNVFVEAVKKKYPNITLEMVKRGQGTQPVDLVLEGNEVDLIVAWNDVLTQFTTLDLLYDITPLTKQEQVDLGRFDPTILAGIKEGFDPNKLLGLPLGTDFYALFYNKDIFDRFGVPYPKDGMTWDDAYTLAKQLTRNDNGVQFKGLDPEGIEKLGNPLSLPYVDPKTEKASVDNESWRKVFELLKKIWSIPGNENSITNHGGTVNRFVKDRNVAMTATHQMLGGLAGTEINWDIAQYPSYPEKLNTYGMVKAAFMSIATNSKHKNEAMKVLEVLTSDEVQKAFTRQSAMISPLKNINLDKDFGADIPYLKDKNVAAIFKSKPAPFVAQTIYTEKARSTLQTKYKDYQGGKDLNTALREADEEINKMIQQMKTAK